MFFKEYFLPHFSYFFLFSFFFFLVFVYILFSWVLLPLCIFSTLHSPSLFCVCMPWKIASGKWCRKFKIWKEYTFFFHFFSFSLRWVYRGCKSKNYFIFSCRRVRCGVTEWVKSRNKDGDRNCERRRRWEGERVKK